MYGHLYGHIVQYLHILINSISCSINFNFSKNIEIECISLYLWCCCKKKKQINRCIYKLSQCRIRMVIWIPGYLYSNMLYFILDFGQAQDNWQLFVYPQIDLNIQIAFKCWSLIHTHSSTFIFHVPSGQIRYF